MLYAVGPSVKHVPIYSQKPKFVSVHVTEKYKTHTEVEYMCCRRIIQRLSICVVEGFIHVNVEKEALNLLHQYKLTCNCGSIYTD